MLVLVVILIHCTTCTCWSSGDTLALMMRELLVAPFQNFPKFVSIQRNPFTVRFKVQQQAPFSQNPPSLYWRLKRFMQRSSWHPRPERSELLCKRCECPSRSKHSPAASFLKKKKKLVHAKRLHLTNDFTEMLHLKITTGHQSRWEMFKKETSSQGETVKDKSYKTLITSCHPQLTVLTAQPFPTIWIGRL